jgi:hypothetical protein
MALRKSGSHSWKAQPRPVHRLMTSRNLASATFISRFLGSFTEAVALSSTFFSCCSAARACQHRSSTRSLAALHTAAVSALPPTPTSPAQPAVAGAGEEEEKPGTGGGSRSDRGGPMGAVWRLQTARPGPAASCAPRRCGPCPPHSSGSCPARARSNTPADTQLVNRAG